MLLGNLDIDMYTIMKSCLHLRIAAEYGHLHVVIEETGST